MFKHNLLIIYRHFKRYKISFLINLAGLSAGMACTLLIYLWVNDELSIDKFHKNDNRLYQVMINHNESQGIHTAPDSPGLLAETMMRELPEVELATEDTDIDWFADNFVLSNGVNNFNLKGKFSGKHYFQLFSFNLTEGNAAQVLSKKNGIVISQKAALVLFKTTKNVIGKPVHWQLTNHQGEATVTGVFKNLPANSTEHFDFILPFEVFKDMVGQGGRFNWYNYLCYTYVLLHKDINLSAFNNKIKYFLKDKTNDKIFLFITPYSSRYLYGHYENGRQTGGRIIYVRLFSIIAIFILAIACINFMNLATARASRRMKEIGVKKTMGVSRKMLILQYMSESVLLSVLSLAVAMAVVILFMPQFNRITGKELMLRPGTQFLLVIFTVTIITGIVSGSYPALYLSGFNPISVLKGKLTASFGELWTRRGLVMIQFIISIFLMVSVLVVYKQIEYIRTKNLGYSRDNIIIFPNEGIGVKNPDLLLTELKKIPGVLNATSSDHTLLKNTSYTGGLKWPGKDPDTIIRFENARVYYDFIETMGIKIKEGRSFSRDYGLDKEGLIFNETAIKVMGLKDPVGKTVNLWGKERKIIGVVKDFNFSSLHEKIGPLFFRLIPDALQFIMVRIAAGKEKETLDRLHAFYKKFNPGYTFDYTFMDQEYQKLYSSEKRISVLSKYFAGLAIFISCLGLLGLSAFTAEHRIKEIGIRKILGLSVFGIIRLLSADFTKIVLIAIVLALPLSYVIAGYWLDGFAYRTELSWWMFAVSGLSTLIITWLIVGWQALKAATVNPLQYLRDE